jgi:hypothetical protein
MTEPVHFHVERPAAPRDRWGTAFRPILIIPHAILAGGPLVGFGSGPWRTGVLGWLALVSAGFDWFAILFTGHPLAGLQQLKRLYLGWRARLLAYGCYLRDEYPPFGDGPYPAWLELPEEPVQRDRTSVALRLFLLVPHLIVLGCVFVVQAFVSVIAWFSIVFTRRLNERLWHLTRDLMGYALRVETYALLVHDRFPSFSLSADRAFDVEASAAAR